MSPLVDSGTDCVYRNILWGETGPCFASFFATVRLRDERERTTVFSFDWEQRSANGWDTSSSIHVVTRRHHARHFLPGRIYFRDVNKTAWRYKKDSLCFLEYMYKKELGSIHSRGCHFQYPHLIHGRQWEFSDKGHSIQDKDKVCG